MNTILISYDLGSPETSEDYKKVIDYIKSFDGWAKPLYSFWFIKSDKTTTTIRDEINKLIDNNDKVLVMNVSGDYWASYGLDKDITDWMENNL